MKRYIHSACNKNNKPIKAATEQERIDLIRRVTNEVIDEYYRNYDEIDIHDLREDVKQAIIKEHNPILDLEAMENYDDNGAAFESAIYLIYDTIDDIAKESDKLIIDMDE